MNAIKKAALVAAIVALSGCNWNAVYVGTKSAREAGCFITTEEFRAAIRDRQELKTNICGDDLDAE